MENLFWFSMVKSIIFIELREELRREGFIFRTAGDTEVLLAAFSTLGL